MNILIGCEFSGVVRRAFRALGHNAWSCDILPSDDQSPYHFTCDIMDVLEGYYGDKHGNGPPYEKHLFTWDVAVFHPPCTYLCGSGQHWNKRRPERIPLTEAAVEFFRALLDAPIPRICVENPVGIISTRIRKPDQIIQPWMFGEDASKTTCLWLKGLPPLEVDPANVIQPRWVDGKPRWDNQTDSGQNRLGPSADRWAKRSITYQGIADAMAKQWGNLA